MGRPRSKNVGELPRLRQKGHAFYYDHGGKPRVWERLGSDRSGALRRYAEIEAGKQAQDLNTVGGFVDKVLSSMPVKLSEGTKQNYRRLGSIIKKRFGTCPITQVRPGPVQEYLDLATARMEARNAVVFFKLVLNKAVLWERIPVNPLDKLRLPPQDRRTRYLEDDEYLKIREQLPEDGPFRLALEIAYVLALRVSGVAGLKWEHIRGDRVIYQPPKSKRPLRVNLTEELIDLFARCKVLPGGTRSDYVICKRSGEGYSPRTVSNVFKRAARAAGVDDAVFHDVRAKSASDDEPTAKQRLLHMDQRTTDIYLRRATVIDPIKPVRGK